VGLELRPRRAPDAATPRAVVAQEPGQQSRDELWSHPDLFPTAEDLDSPPAFLPRRAASAAEETQTDAARTALLEGTAGTETPSAHEVGAPDEETGSSEEPDSQDEPDSGEGRGTP